VLFLLQTTDTVLQETHLKLGLPLFSQGLKHHDALVDHRRKGTTRRARVLMVVGGLIQRRVRGLHVSNDIYNNCIIINIFK
jgi:hypothetical protein